MINKVFLLWHAYITKELLVIGSLSKDGNRYIFKYEKDAARAKDLGCFLPFPYTENELYFSMLPSFFTQRMLTSRYNMDKFGVKYDSNNELALLTYGDSVKNNDNFRIVSEDSYKLLSSLNDKDFNSKLTIRK